MGQEYPAKTFQSGNSVALRLPKALGVKAGEAATITQEENGDLVVRRADRPKRKFNIAKVAGSAKGLNYIKPEDRIFDERPSMVAQRMEDARLKNDEVPPR
jgi:antitoxin VapB